MQEIKNISSKHKFKIKTFSLILGYMLWSVFSESSLKKIWVKVPLTFYANNEQQFKIDGPEKIQVQISGINSDLQNIDFENLAIYVDVTNLNTGKHAVELKAKNLFLPKNVKLMSYKPYNILVDINKNPLT